MTHFRRYANYYDLLYKEKDYFSESEYIHKLIQSYSRNSKTVLELGCGTGKHAFHLAQKGYTLHCVDLSQEMLAIAKKELKSNYPGLTSQISFEHCDIKALNPKKKFDVIISLFHVVSYLTSDVDIRKTFSNVSSMLEPGGIFIFDCWYGPAVLSLKPEEREKIFEDDKLIIKRKTIPVHKPDDNIIDVNFYIEVTNKKSGENDSFNELHPMRYLFTPEITEFLLESRLGLIAHEEWLTGNKLDTDTWNACYIARL